MTTIVDGFARQATGGWGTTPTGHSWHLSGGAASERVVAGGAGRVTLSENPGELRIHHLDRPWGDGEVLAQVSAGQVSETEALLAGVVFRRAASGIFYRARLLFGTDSTVSVDITRGTALVGSRADTAITYTPGFRLWVRARVDGHRARARVWPVGDSEPAVWDVDETVTTDPVPTGDMGVMVSAFANNTNTSPHIDWHRVEVSYRTVVDNPLNGSPGVEASDTSLAVSAVSGTVTAATGGAVYSDTRTVHSLPTLRVDTGSHRQDTPAVETVLPDVPWSMRWYMWLPPLRDAGFGLEESRWAVAFDHMGLTFHETANNDITVRIQPQDLAAASAAPETAGEPISPGQWVRCELVSDGADTLMRIYPGHSTTGPRMYTWPDTTLPGGVVQFTGFRFRHRTTLYRGDQGSPVAALQDELIDLGYNLGTWGADGDYGDLTYDAVVAFQQDQGLTPVDGIAGPETRAAIDLALGRTVEPLWLSHLAAGAGEWIGPAEPVLVQEEHRRRLVLGMRL
ncbi:peptidoglycan-binding domain-containing protein [Nocardiopsis sp. LOL_012]|uniref:peptidoglycan-binding domain-containing protein n=1 Tax=Nocardiopsis sp. LOL_012 TaxID=3345409 RepID=UPI003A8B6F32